MSRWHLKGLAVVPQWPVWGLSECWLMRCNWSKQHWFQIQPPHWMSQRPVLQMAGSICRWTLLTRATLWSCVSQGLFAAIIKIREPQWLDTANAFHPLLPSVPVRGRAGLCTGTRDSASSTSLPSAGRYGDGSTTRRVSGRWGNQVASLCYLLLYSLLRLDTSYPTERQAREYRPAGCWGHGGAVLSLCFRTKTDGPPSFLIWIPPSALSGFVPSFTLPVTRLSSCHAWNSIFRTLKSP